VGKCGFHGGALMALYACDVKQQVLFIKLFWYVP
jgi:hypothetical protein